MIQITADIAIPEDELHLDFVRASGPGGQNVNRVASAVQLRFDAAESAHLPASVKARLKRLAGKRMTMQGVLVIEAKRYRSQERNRQDAIDRFTALVRRAAEPPKPRTATRPTRASRVQRLEGKRRRSATKRLRQAPRNDEQ
ncbi:MAG: alternative ribosome rescue aminoacyl-tRNA hydrolase ArfB [Anaerolineae bacterium]|nr:alternative ribosome rescue aminoacyl-tRNA hydrolase ArfB [Anaerolineae bacterium]